MKTNINHYDEREMVVNFCKAYFKNNKIFSVEVPFFDNSIDVVYKDRKGNLYAIEFKLKDWRKGIKQARNHSIGAEYLCLCLPKQEYKEVLHKEIKENKLGLILFDMQTQKVSMEIKPQKNTIVKRAKKILFSNLEYSLSNNNYQLLLSL